MRNPRSASCSSNPRFQQGFKAWLKSLLAPRNPYTGIPLANDPALALIQTQNEDSLLFFTSIKIVGKQAEILGRQFGDWLKIKYGTLADAVRAWDNNTIKEDRLDDGIVGLLLAWEWTQPRQGGRKKRLDDQLQFYSETMFRFNREIERYLHEELGCKQLVNANNWRSVDAIKTGDAERWSYTANEVLAVNRYYTTIHHGPNVGWRIDPGDSFEDASVLLRPRELPVNLKQAAGHPMMITESHWVPPLGYQSEGPFLVAAYQSVNGVDLLDWTTTSEPEWSNQDRAVWDAASRAKWQIATPMILGQFPAAALLFRKGYLKQGPGQSSRNIAPCDRSGSGCHPSSRRIPATIPTGTWATPLAAPARPETLTPSPSWSVPSRSITIQTLPRRKSPTFATSSTTTARWSTATRARLAWTSPRRPLHDRRAPSSRVSAGSSRTSGSWRLSSVSLRIGKPMRGPC